MQNDLTPTGTEAIQSAGFFATALLDQLAEHLDEIDAAGVELAAGQSDSSIRRVRARRIGSLCDRGRDFVGLARQQLEIIARHNQVASRREISEVCAIERASGGLAG